MRTWFRCPFNRTFPVVKRLGAYRNWNLARQSLPLEGKVARRKARRMRCRRRSGVTLSQFAEMLSLSYTGTAHLIFGIP